MPELKQINEELAEGLKALQGKLAPVMAKVQKTLDGHLKGEEAVVTKHGMSYLEMKSNLLQTYAINLSFYLLLKLEGKQVSSHPVIGRLVHLKLLLEKLRPLDQKLVYQVDKLVRQAVLGEAEGPANDEEQRLAYRPNLNNLETAEAGDDQNMSDEHADQESDIEDDDSEESEEVVAPKSVGKKRAKPDSADDSETEQPSKKLKTGDQKYKVSKVNPVHYSEAQDKAAKKQQRAEAQTKHKLNKSSYIRMLREEMDDKPEEVSGLMGMTAKSDYIKEMENLEKVEQMYFTRMRMTKAQKKLHKQMMQQSSQDRLDNFDELKDIDALLAQSSVFKQKGK